MQKKIFNITALKDYLVKQLEGTGWDEALHFFLKSSDLDTIFERLRYESEELKHLTVPRLKYIFRPFTECHLKDVKVVLIYPEPVNYMDMSTGLALSFDGKYNVPMLTLEFGREIAETVYKVRRDDRYEFNPNLVRLSKQGVLLLNLTPTARVFECGKHANIWKEYSHSVVDALVSKCSDAVFIIIGGRSGVFTKPIMRKDSGIVWYEAEDINPKFRTAYKMYPWRCNNVFNKTNDSLVEKGKTPIIW